MARAPCVFRLEVVGLDEVTPVELHRCRAGAGYDDPRAPSTGVGLLLGDGLADRPHRRLLRQGLELACVPMAISSWPACSTTSGDGLVRKVPAASRTARIKRAGAVADLGVSQGPTDEGRAGAEGHLAETELEAAVVHHDVEEVGHGRLQRRGPPCGHRRSSAG